jgi:hypothetical protein
MRFVIAFGFVSLLADLVYVGELLWRDGWRGVLAPSCTQAPKTTSASTPQTPSRKATALELSSPWMSPAEELAWRRRRR